MQELAYICKVTTKKMITASSFMKRLNSQILHVKAFQDKICKPDFAFYCMSTDTGNPDSNRKCTYIITMREFAWQENSFCTS